MKICFITDEYNPRTGGQYSSLNQISLQLKKYKIKHLVVHKQSKILNNKHLLKKTLSSYDIFHFLGIGEAPNVSCCGGLGADMRQRRSSASRS